MTDVVWTLEMIHIDSMLMRGKHVPSAEYHLERTVGKGREHSGG
jgi:hypothetical protein